MTTTIFPMDLPPPIETPRPLSDHEAQSFIENGFLAVPGLVSSDEVEELRHDTVRIARGEYPCASIDPAPTNLTDDDVLRTILCIHQPHYISPVMERYARHPLICGALSQITAAHLPYWDGSVKCMQSMLFVKPPTFQF